MHCSHFRINKHSNFEYCEADWHARRPSPDSSADRPSLARGCPCHFPRLHRPSLPPVTPLKIYHSLQLPAVPVHPTPLCCLEWPRGRMPGADRGRGQGRCLGSSELSLYLIGCYVRYWMRTIPMMRLPCALPSRST